MSRVIYNTSIANDSSTSYHQDYDPFPNKASPPLIFNKYETMFKEALDQFQQTSNLRFSNQQRLSFEQGNGEAGDLFKKQKNLNLQNKSFDLQITIFNQDIVKENKRQMEKYFKEFRQSINLNYVPTHSKPIQHLDDNIIAVSYNQPDANHQDQTFSFNNEQKAMSKNHSLKRQIPDLFRMKSFYSSRLPNITSMSQSPARKIKERLDYIKIKEQFKNVRRGPRLYKSFVKDTTIQDKLRQDYFKDDVNVITEYISRNIQPDIKALTTASNARRKYTIQEEQDETNKHSNNGNDIENLNTMITSDSNNQKQFPTTQRLAFTSQNPKRSEMVDKKRLAKDISMSLDISNTSKAGDAQTKSQQSPIIKNDGIIGKRNNIMTQRNQYNPVQFNNSDSNRRTIIQTNHLQQSQNNNPTVNSIASLNANSNHNNSHQNQKYNQKQQQKHHMTISEAILEYEMKHMSPERREHTMKFNKLLNFSLDDKICNLNKKLHGINNEIKKFHLSQSRNTYLQTTKDGIKTSNLMDRVRQKRRQAQLHQEFQHVLVHHHQQSNSNQQVKFDLSH
ncbi:UNKNOWN [Stylonychia lemnae]|uniref:Uncharacterized protein n=1 Tax=Stylonychia lemnae TaxID=5949 RepID=A0A077ZUB8_STYLE|nr:UNKNOWN [Stylonychia lemnae]|eukprot:CDW73164.1 UNKNOWN [Stylonychia lemnae]